eukprot:3419312-Rhodomonas_salina.1
MTAWRRIKSRLTKIIENYELSCQNEDGLMKDPSGGAAAGASAGAAAGASAGAGQQSMDVEATGETEDDDLMEGLYGEVPGPPSLD